MEKLDLETCSTLKCLKFSLAKHQKKCKEKLYKKNNWDLTVINFKDFSKGKQLDCLVFWKKWDSVHCIFFLSKTMEKIQIS